MSEKILEVSGLNVSYESSRKTPFEKKKSIQVLKDVSFSMEKGEILGLVGESGSGKTTLARAILGMIPYEGTIVKTVANPQMVFQDPYGSLNPAKKVGWILEEPLRLKGGYTKEERQEKVISMLGKVGLDEKLADRYPRQLSGGQRQRVCIAGALMLEPKLLITDEPVSALDVTIQAQILELMKNLKEKIQMSIIFITHNLGVVAEICDKVSVMYGGRIVEQGPVDDIFYHTGHPYTKGLLRSMPRVDAESYERLIPIEGTPVDLLNPPAGCPFAPRCEHCMKVCLEKMPPYATLGEGHISACWLHQKDAQ